jgi:phytoene dehydrogenase-like protein
VETLMANQAGRVVIIGAGHNGLVTAFYLAKAGLTPLVLERREIVGGIAVTEEIYPGFRCPVVAHSARPLLPRIMNDLRLEKEGLFATTSDVQTIALHPDGLPLRIYKDPERTASELTSHSSVDARKYADFHACFQRIGDALRPLLSITPPGLDVLRKDDYLNLGRLGLNFRGLDKKDAYRLLRWGPMPVADLVGEWFENELLRAAIEARGIYGCFAGPWSAGSSIALLMDAAFSGEPVSIRGGAGALTQALAKAASIAGAEIRTNASVAHIRVKDDAAASVVLESGEEIVASAVISSADPHRTFLQLVDATNLDPDFLMKIRAYRAVGCVAKVNLALSGLPVFKTTRDDVVDLAGRIHIGPDTDYLERGFDQAKYGNFSSRPFLDIRVPSLADSSLAPQGSHVMSIHVQYAPYRLREGDWKTRRDELGKVVLDTLALYAPKIRDLIVHQQIITPLDMEETYGLSGGHMFHGEHALDQLFAFRPLLGWARYRTPIRGLYLCGSGTHPGGGITGAPGANASREIIKDLKSR